LNPGFFHWCSDEPTGLAAHLATDFLTTRGLSLETTRRSLGQRLRFLERRHVIRAGNAGGANGLLLLLGKMHQKTPGGCVGKEYSYIALIPGSSWGIELNYGGIQMRLCVHQGIGVAYNFMLAVDISSPQVGFPENFVYDAEHTGCIYLNPTVFEDHVLRFLRQVVV
jgi:hypothetical protein